MCDKIIGRWRGASRWWNDRGGSRGDKEVGGDGEGEDRSEDEVEPGKCKEESCLSASYVEK